MDPRASSAEGGRLTIDKLQSLYDLHRYIDAFQASESYWMPAVNLDDLSVEELIFAARLATRLGGDRLSRRLFIEARKRDASLPLVRYFTHHMFRPRELLLDDLAAFEANPELGGDDDDLRGSWLASYAHIWAVLRNYSRASELLRDAHALNPESAWIHSREADVLGMADNWDGALEAAEHACRIDPHSPWALGSRAAALMNLGRIDEAARRLTDEALCTQSIQVVQTGCWYHCAFAEVLEGREREEEIETARAMARRMEPLAPLGDRDFKTNLARTWLDIAELAGDHSEMEKWSGAARSPFHRQVLANLQGNPGGRRICLPYRRQVQRHSECVPTSVGSALSATGIEVSVEELAADVTFGGTAEWAAADWLRKKGLHVRFFNATAGITTSLIHAGIGFVVTWEDDQSGHAVAIVGVDEAAGTILAHDPMTFRRSEYGVVIFERMAGPLGVLGMAAVPPEKAGDLDAVLAGDAGMMEGAQTYQKALLLHGPSAARAVVTGIVERYPSHPGARYLQAIQNVEDGRTGEAVAALRELWREYPNSRGVRIHLMIACRATGNTALLRQTLQAVVETGTVPGLEAQTDWLRPHPRYVWEYADMLRMSISTRSRAKVLLRSVLRASWTAAGAWHILADLRWVERENQSALLAYSIASFLEPHNEHYAHSYFNALCHCGREPEGIAWLEHRVQRMGASSPGFSTWITYIDALEDRGHPESAIAACRAALEQHPSSAVVISYAVPFLCRMGMWDEAGRQLRALEANESKASFHHAALSYHAMRGEPAEALRHAEAAVADSPGRISARNELLDVLSGLEGRSTAALRAYEWMRLNPGKEPFEDAFCRFAEDALQWRKIRVLRQRTKRNSDDAWAWRELALIAIGEFEQASEARRTRLRPRILSYLSEADRIASDDAATSRTHGLWMEAERDWHEAVRYYLEAMERQPENFFSYRRAWEASARFPDQERRDLWERIELIYMRNSGHLPHAADMMRLLVQRFGAREAEQIMERWRIQYSDDPNILEAAADLLLDHGRGRSDTSRALDLLRTAVDRYPYHSGLRFSLARACGALGEYERAKDVFEELVRRHPENTSALIQLALVHQHEGRLEEALGLLDRAASQEPVAPGPVETRARILMEAGRPEESQELIARALQSQGDQVPVYQFAIAIFSEWGKGAKAVEAARRGVVAFPRGAYLWLLLGRTLQDFPRSAASGEIESCLRRSLQLNESLFQTADLLAVFLTGQSHFDEAIHLLEMIEPKLADPSPARGRAAWIKRKGGAGREAVTELAALLRNAPWYLWGWNLLLSWLEEDKDWRVAREILDSIPPQMLTDLSIRLKRVQLLERAGTDVKAIDGDWQSLLEDHPESMPLYQHRYDSLTHAKRWKEAAELLRLAVSIDSSDCFLLARMIEVECREKKLDEALRDALQISFSPSEQSPWPVDHAWQLLRDADMEDSLSNEFQYRLQKGDEPARRALARCAEQILRDSSGGWRLLRESSLNHATRRIRALAEVIEGSQWSKASHVADLFSEINGSHREGLVVANWNFMQREGSESNTDVWAQVGRAMVNLGQRRDGRQLMRDWRARSGVMMWMIGNYLMCIPRLRREDLQEVVSTCGDALAGLRHDHCARYIAFMQAEACALAADMPALLATWQKFPVYFDRPLAEGDFFAESQRYLLGDLPVLVEMLEQNDGRRAWRMVFKLRLRNYWTQEARRFLRKTGQFLRILLALLLILSVLAPWIFG